MAMVDLPDTMGDLPDIMGDLPDTMGDLPDTIGDLPDTMSDLPDTLGDLPDTMGLLVSWFSFKKPNYTEWTSRPWLVWFPDLLYVSAICFHNYLALFNTTQ